MLRPGGRPGGGRRRTGHPVRRASAGLTPVRAGALLALLVGIGGLYGLSTTAAFTVRRTEITGAAWTPQQEITAALAVPEDQNLFALRTAALEANLLAIPAIRAATVTVALPDEIRVVVKEREALVAWEVGSHRYLVDASGLLFAELRGAGPAGVALPVIDDRRIASATLVVGSTLDAISLDAALRLGSLTPADLGSAATSLELRVDDADGFAISGRPAGWTAVFGFYTPTLRTTDLIPGQVRLLRSLLLDREGSVLRVILADERSGTLIPRGAAKPSPRPSSSTAP